MPQFELQGSVAENVLALRKMQGSAVRPLSRDDLAAMIAKKHTKDRAPNGTTVQRWEEGVEPDYESSRIMAEMAGVTFELFTLGDPAKRAAQPSHAPASKTGLPPFPRKPVSLVESRAKKKRKRGKG